ncbi:MULTISPECIES: cytidine deaminase [unclassified Roseitalea]|nr:MULTISPECIES: cytidine deaminase [unclassified Roseitalea]
MAYLNSDNAHLVQEAKDVLERRFRDGWHAVGAALRLRSGEVVTGVHLEADIGRIAVCAEAIALGRAVTEIGSSDIETIVAVYHSADGKIRIVAPCGMCREMICDYAPSAVVLMPDADDEESWTPVPISDLLPGKYQRDRF